MKLIPAETSLAWMAEHGIGPDPRYPRSNGLGIAGALDYWRPWSEPSAISELVSFVDTLIEAIVPHGPWLLYPHEQGRWSFGGDGSPMHNRVFDVIIRGAGIPLDWVGGARFELAEREQVVALLAGSLLCGWGLGEDFYCISAEGAAMLMTSHHEQVTGYFRSVEELRKVELVIAAAGFDDPDTTLESGAGTG